MKTTTARVATTHVDLQGDKLTVGALTDMVRQITECYLPMTLEHDIRYPPIGRAVSARVVDLPDGEHALEVVSEVFEQGDSLDSLAGDGRRMTVWSESTEKFAVHYDRAFTGPAQSQLLDDLHRLAPSDPKPQEYGKKSLEPVVALTIVVGLGSLTVGPFFKGFFQKLGEDTYDRLRDLLAQHWGRRRSRQEILDVCICAAPRGQPLEVHVVVSQPSSRRIQRLFDSGLKTLDDLLSGLPLRDHDIARVVLTYGGDSLALSYVVRGDCVPLPVRIPPENLPDPG